MTTPLTVPADLRRSAIQLPSGLALPFQVKDLDDEARTFSGLAAAYSQDLGGDVIMPGAFRKTLADWRRSKSKVLPLMDSHSRGSVRAVVGKMIEAKEVDDGLETAFQLIDGPDGDEVYRRVKGGYVDALSIGYQAMEIRNPTEEEQRQGVWRFLKEVRLLEVSVVVFPMNPDARIDGGTVKTLLKAAGERNLTPEELDKLRAVLTAAESGALPKCAPTQPAAGLAPEDPRRLKAEEQLRALIIHRLGAR